jgi:hypothetical protein
MDIFPKPASDRLVSLRGQRFGWMVFGNDHNAFSRDRAAPTPIRLGIEPQNGMRRNLHIFVNDRPANPAMATDLDAIEQDRFLDD